MAGRNNSSPFWKVLGVLLLLGTVGVLTVHACTVTPSFLRDSAQGDR